MNAQIQQIIRESFTASMQKKYDALVVKMLPDVDPATATLTPVQMYAAIMLMKADLSCAARSELSSAARVLEVMNIEAQNESLCAAIRDLKVSIDTARSSADVVLPLPAEASANAPAEAFSGALADALAASAEPQKDNSQTADLQKDAEDPLGKERDYMKARESSLSADYHAWLKLRSHGFFLDYLAHRGWIEDCKIARRLGYANSLTLTMELAAGGKLDAFKWAVGAGCHYEWFACANNAVEHGHLDVLKFIHLNCVDGGTTWTRNSILTFLKTAIIRDGFRIIEWICMRYPSVDLFPELIECAEAAHKPLMVKWFQNRL